MRRPWNITNPAVFAISTFDGDHLNVNICTYIMAVSRNPKMYAISIEKGSKTLENLQAGSKCIIQLLRQSQSHLVRPLGKKSGHGYDKQRYLETQGELTLWQDYLVLKNCCAYIYLETNEQSDVGDHILFTGKAIKYKTLDEKNILTLQHLIDQRIIL